MKTAFYIALFIFALVQVYVRLAPMTAARWHVDPFAASDPGRSGKRAQIIIPIDPEDALARLDELAGTEPRTKRLAGDIESGRISYITRTGFWGFPDVTTIAARPHAEGCELAILARLRFGKYDFGVNAKRVEAWRAAAGL